MEKQQLGRLMRIAQKTKSPVIVLDKDQNEMVILPLQAYEELLDSYSGSEDEEFELPEEFFSDIPLDEVDEEVLDKQFEDFTAEPSRGVESAVKEVADVRHIPIVEKTAEIASEQLDELSEEQFYLEPVE